MDKPYLSVIIPAYNEESRIGKTLDAVSGYLKKQDFSSEVIVVSGGSTDRTVEVARSKASEIPDLSVVAQTKQENRGKGEAVKAGMLRASGTIRLFTDADNSTDIAHFDKMRPLFDEGYDVVIGSRHPWDAAGARQAVSQAWYKRLMGQAGNLFIQLVAVWGIWDTQCGFKAFRDEAAQKIFSRQRISGWGFDVEALALARKFGYRIGIIPVYWINDPVSHVRFSTYFHVLWETVMVRLNLLAKRYAL
ncbi:MAG: glycosyltransferase family 2 protein [Candidatus Niyogibacteria bacterium]|nr:glycosyltransferase family 2 protein [Candidatus Niyogibacteria bacterium]